MAPKLSALLFSRYALIWPLLFLTLYSFSLFPSEEERLMARVRARRYEGVVYHDPGLFEVLLDVLASVFVAGSQIVTISLGPFASFLVPGLLWAIAAAAVVVLAVFLFLNSPRFRHATTSTPRRDRHDPDPALAPVLARQDPEPVIQPQAVFDDDNAPPNELARAHDIPAVQPAPLPVHVGPPAFPVVQADLEDRDAPGPVHNEILGPVDQPVPIDVQADDGRLIAPGSPVADLHPLSEDARVASPSSSGQMTGDTSALGSPDASPAKLGSSSTAPFPASSPAPHAPTNRDQVSFGDANATFAEHELQTKPRHDSDLDAPSPDREPLTPSKRANQGSDSSSFGVEFSSASALHVAHEVSLSDLSFGCPSSSPRQELRPVPATDMAAVQVPSNPVSVLEGSESGSLLPVEASSPEASLLVTNKDQSSVLLGVSLEVSTGLCVAMGSEDPFAVGSLETEDTVEKRKAEAFFAPVSTSWDSIMSFSLPEDMPSSQEPETGSGGETEDEASVLGAEVPSTDENDEAGMSPPLPALPPTPAFERGQERRKSQQMFVFGLDRTCEWGFTHDAVDSCRNVLRTPACLVPAGSEERRVAPTMPTLKGTEVVFSPPTSPRLVHLPKTPSSVSVPVFTFSSSSPTSASTSRRVQTAEQGSLTNVKGKGKETTFLRPTSPRLLSLPETPAAIRAQEQRVCAMMDHHEANTSDEWRFTAAAVEGCHGVLRTPVPVAPRLFVKEERLETPVLSPGTRRKSAAAQAVDLGDEGEASFVEGYALYPALKR